MGNNIGKILSLSLIGLLFSTVIQVSPAIPQRETALYRGKAVAEEAAAAEMQLSIENPEPIGPPESVPRERLERQAIPEALETMTPLPPHTFEGIDIDENEDLTGFLIIPPDPIAAVGPEHVVSVVNSSIEWYPKTGKLKISLSLEGDFFAELEPQSRPFDPKVIYDQYAGRFVVIALEQDDSPTRISRILVAVSDDGDPNGDWHLHSIDSKLVINSDMGWADYPGLAIDEEAVYITANIFDFVPNIFGSFDFLASRLWILEKGIGSGGLYDGGAASVALYDPSTKAGLSQAFTLQPAHVFGPGGVAEGVGTFLVNSGWGDRFGREYLSVIRVDNPLDTPSFSNQFIFLDDITVEYGLPDAPQSGTSQAIETNDGRVLHAVWRNNSLWAVNTVNPPNPDPDAGQATAHWYQIDTSTLNALALVQQGNIGGEEIAPDTHTFFPAIAVDALGNVGIGFSASAPTIFPGAYITGRNWSDPPESMRPAKTLAAGVDYYIRTFGGTRNRWGDYSGMSVDPTDDRTFWVYNEYALARGTPTDGEDGRWGTRFGSLLLCEGDFDEDGDVDGLDLKELIDNITLLDLSEFGIEYGRTNCLLN